MAIDLNCDMGESFGVYTLGDDDAMLDIVTSANVACGFHAGDPLVMHRTITRALANGVAVGAHPSYLDLWGFGRRQIIGDTPEEIVQMMVYQIGAIQAVAAAAGHKVTYVKPHGALANRAAVDQDIANAIADAIRRIDPELVFMVMPGMATERAGETHDLRIVREVYADRTYDDNGNLTSRKKEGAVIHDPDAAADRVVRMLEEQAITTVSGAKLPAHIDTVCVHGDNPAAVAMARRIRAALEAGGATIAPFS
ncbi:MAG: 5-oxoprolinase subunit PxpA [Rhodospirillales bacterium]|nr:5-oxoprolinase subunit PxpA [Rhodospirillales bacterium]